MNHSVSLLLVFFLLTPNVSAATYTTFTHDEYDISFEYPAEWIKSSAKSAYDGRVSSLWVKRIDAFNAPRIDIRWLGFPNTDTARDIHKKEAFEKDFAELTEKYDDFIITKKDDSELFGHVALRYRFEASFFNKLIREEWVFVDFNGTRVEFKYKATPSNFDEYYDQFEHVIDSFSLQKPAPEQKVQETPKEVTNEEVAEYQRWRPFSDVPTGAWYSDDLQDARIAGFVSGYKDANDKPLNKYGPSDPVTVAELLKMTIKATAVPSYVYDNPEEVTIDHWSNKYVTYAIQKNVGFKNVNTEGFRDLIVNHPNKPITRAEAAGVVHAFFQIGGVLDKNDPRYAIYFKNGGFIDTVHNYFKEPIRDLVSIGVLTGDTDANGNLTGYFRPESNINRAEAMMLVIRANSKLCLITNLKCPAE